MAGSKHSGAAPGRLEGYDCHIVAGTDGPRLHLQLRVAAPAGPCTLSLTPPLAERLAYDLLCQCASTKGRPLGGPLPAYAPDRLRLRYDPEQDNARLDASARGEHGITLQISGEVLQDLRRALERLP
jgi:hypothetical protein